MMKKSITFITIFRLKKCYFHYDMQETLFIFYEKREMIKQHFRCFLLGGFTFSLVIHNRK
jgi:hypothetical protein